MAACQIICFIILSDFLFLFFQTQYLSRYLDIEDRFTVIGIIGRRYLHTAMEDRHGRLF